MHRRELLTGVAALTTSLAGCADYPPFKRVEIRDSIEVRREKSSWELDTKVFFESNVGRIHGVELIAYDADGYPTGEKVLGDLGSPGLHWTERIPVTVQCFRFPHVITFSVEDDLCNEEVPLDVDVFRWNGDSWAYKQERSCGAGLPPAAIEHTSAPTPAPTTSPSTTTRPENESAAEATTR